MTIFARITAFLFESARLELISKQFGIPVDKLEQDYLPADPTGGKYLTWVLRMAKGGKLRFPEDQAKVRERLTQFDQFKKLKNWEGPRDINQYQSFAMLAQDCFTAYHDGLQSNKERTRQLASEGAKAIAELEHEGEHWVIYEITTFEALDALGAQQTEWCVKDRKYFDAYAKDGLPYYMAVNDSGPQMLLHKPSSQCMNKWDEPCDPGLFEQVGIDCFELLSVPVMIKRLDAAYRGRDRKGLNRLLDVIIEGIAKNTGHLALENYDVLGDNPTDEYNRPVKGGCLVKILIEQYKVPLERMDEAIIDAFKRDEFEHHLSTYSVIRKERWEWYEKFLSGRFRSDHADLVIKLAVEYSKLHKLRWPALEAALVNEMKADRVITNFNLTMRYWTAVGEGAWPEAEFMLNTILEEIKIGGGGPGASGHNLTVARNYAVKYNEMAGEKRIHTSVLYYT